MASGIGADCEIQDFDFVGNVTGDQEAGDIFDVRRPTFLLGGCLFCNGFKNPAGHLAVDYSFVVGGFPLGDFRAGGLDGEDGIDVAGFERADGQRSYFPFSCSSASERRT
jgi:hypothetical protein